MFCVRLRAAKGHDRKDKIPFTERRELRDLVVTSALLVTMFAISPKYTVGCGCRAPAPCESKGYNHWGALEGTRKRTHEETGRKISKRAM